MNNNILNEVYFGKDKKLKQIEGLLGLFRKKYFGKYFNIQNRVLADKNRIQFEKAIEDYFGFGIFNLHFIESDIPNAYTFPISIRYDIHDSSTDAIIDNGHYKFKKSAQFACIVIITTGIIFNKKYTDDEVMSVIIHEIGHNFFEVLNKKNVPLANIRKGIIFINFITMLLNSMRYISPYNINEIINLTIYTDNNVTKSLLKADRIAYNNKHEINNTLKMLNQATSIFQTINSFMTKTQGFITDILFLFNPFKTISIILASKISNIFGILIMPITFNDEISADNFATFYGYSGALTSAINKITASNNSSIEIFQRMSSIPIISTMYNLFKLPLTLSILAFDSHPNNVFRANDQLKLLERELSKANLDPRIEELIKKDVNDVKSSINKLTSTRRGIVDPDLFQHIVNKIIYNATGGKYIKEIILDRKGRYEEFDARYEEIKKRNINKNN